MFEKSSQAKQNLLFYLLRKYFCFSSVNCDSLFFTFFFLLFLFCFPSPPWSQPIHSIHPWSPAGHTSMGINWLVPAGVHWAAHKLWAAWLWWPEVSWWQTGSLSLWPGRANWSLGNALSAYVWPRAARPSIRGKKPKALGENVFFSFGQTRETWSPSEVESEVDRERNPGGKKKSQKLKWSMKGDKWPWLDSGCPVWPYEITLRGTSKESGSELWKPFL